MLFRKGHRGVIMLDLLRSISIADIIDILFVALLFYSAIVWLKRTRAAFIVRGLFVLVAIFITRASWSSN
jgi:hypothetical protein